jgi:predicted MPP superfamily phosphohydrolase
MLILHVADIHFRHPECDSEMDPDRPFRTQLLRDAGERTRQVGESVDAILVGGDIAYRGHENEYKAATRWLGELATATGCSTGDVFVVPGNHDVDRDVIRTQVSVRNAQYAVATARSERRERELIEQFRDPLTGPALLAPIANYNQFAAQFSCQVWAPEKLCWRQKKRIDNSTELVIHGLTSTLLSGAGAPRNQDDTKFSLYLSPFQTALDPAAYCVNLVLCHHPPDWLLDQDEVEDAVRGRAALHLFGHKHRQRIYCDRSYVRFAAGAVNPDRNETGWEPGYNLIALTTTEQDGVRYLNVSARLLTWQTNPDLFRPRQDENRAEVFSHRITLARVASRATAAAAADVPSGPATAVNQPPQSDATCGRDGEVAMSEPRTRSLVFRFWKLSSSQRREIAQRLKLIGDEDMKLSEPERYGRALIRASEGGHLEDLAAEIERMEGP